MVTPSLSPATITRATFYNSHRSGEDTLMTSCCPRQIQGLEAMSPKQSAIARWERRYLATGIDGILPISLVGGT